MIDEGMSSIMNIFVKVFINFLKAELHSKRSVICVQARRQFCNLLCDIIFRALTLCGFRLKALFSRALNSKYYYQHNLGPEIYSRKVFVGGLPIDIEEEVQIRPWRLADADYLVDVSVPINLRRVVFVGGVPRPIRAVELAHIMDRLYGSVACAGIDTDVEYEMSVRLKLRHIQASKFIMCLSQAVLIRWKCSESGEMELR
ncbi:Cytoplasmic polyadenylation element binding protein [Parelaphostrongylus tenuis]|uniref:Cytoplasmic polyadenylation element binding protein n=1 Tax=Parelaphostrongylus tenuis TaxID=148309 RepID=A0AAD5WII3_PARTN|nr:Cytoplasmic polyadenylation element binding protein [Parelaphostrongylus tenuis]